MSPHVHTFRRWVKPFEAIQGWLGYPESHDIVVYTCRCGEVGYEVPA